MRGVLITFEGVEGSGKTTQMARLGRWLKTRGYKLRRRVEALPEAERLAIVDGARPIDERGVEAEQRAAVDRRETCRLATH